LIEKMPRLRELEQSKRMRMPEKREKRLLKVARKLLLQSKRSRA
jgi:hypothetical protein